LSSHADLVAPASRWLSGGRPALRSCSLTSYRAGRMPALQDTRRLPHRQPRL